jgi:hypothetical protein
MVVWVKNRRNRGLRSEKFPATVPYNRPRGKIRSPNLDELFTAVPTYRKEIALIRNLSTFREPQKHKVCGLKQPLMGTEAAIGMLRGYSIIAPKDARR